jgi:signal transduction histidine kinase
MHDATGPVNTIKGAVELLKKGDLSPEETKRMLTAIEERADRLIEVMDAYYVKTKK